MTLESPGSVARAAAPAPTFSIIATCLVLLGVAVVPAYGQTAAAAKALAEGTAPAESSKAAEETPEAEEEFEWFTTDTPNLRYRVARVPKVEKAFKWIDENRVKMPGGAIFEVVDHDDEWFWVKYFEWIKKPERFKPPETGPSEEEKEQIRASYEIDLAKADRLRLREFDKGLPRAGQWRNGFDVADMNGDGHLDIVFSARRKGASHPNIFLGDGAGNWRAWREAAYPRDQPYDYGDAAAADFNGDGHQDLAFGFHLRGLLVLLGDGEGRFRAWTEGIGLDFPGRGGDATAFSSRAIDVIDWNGDGRMDVIALGEGPKGTQTGTQRSQEEKGFGKLIDTSRGFLVYLNQGDGTWVPERPARDIQQADFGDDFVVADFNGDGHPELVSATRRLGNEHILSVGSEDGAMETRA
ncbi:MAG: VCBS repeat-containing protein, partial [Acidobacteriota bacterium]